MEKGQSHVVFIFLSEYRAGDTIFGSLTILFTILPAIAYAAVTAYLTRDYKTVFSNFFKQLPLVNILKNYDMIREIEVHENIIAEYLRRAEMTTDKKKKDKCKAIATCFTRKLEEMKSSHAIFKGFQAVFESGFQFLLQLMIAFGTDDTIILSYLYKVKTWVWITSLFSFGSMSATFTSLLLELPFQIGKEVYTPIRSSSQLKKFFKLLIPVSLGLFVRLAFLVWTMIFFTWKFTSFLIPAYFMITCLIVSIILNCTIKRTGQKLDSRMREEAVLAVFTAAFLPCVQMFGTGHGVSFRGFANAIGLVTICVCPTLTLLNDQFEMGWTFLDAFTKLPGESSFGSWRIFLAFLVGCLGGILTSTMSAHISSLIMPTNNIFAFKYAVDFEDKNAINTSLSNYPECKCFFKSKDELNTLIPDEGTTLLMYSASKQSFMGTRKLLLPPERRRNDCKGHMVFVVDKLVQTLCYIFPICCYQDRRDYGIDPNIVGSIFSRRNQNTIMKIAKLEETARTLEKIGETKEAQSLMAKAQNYWSEMIDADPYYEKSALMISSQLKDFRVLKLFLDIAEDTPSPDAERQPNSANAISNHDSETTEIEPIPKEMLETFQGKVEYNLQDHKGRSAFILACKENEVNDSETNEETGETLDQRKEVVKLFLKNADRLGIDLGLKDDQGKTGFDYLPEAWIEEIRN